MFIHGNNSFAELSKNLAGYRSENDVGRLSVDNATNFNIVATSLNVLHNYFFQKKLFSNLYLDRFLDISAKPFFPCYSVLQ